MSKLFRHLVQKAISRCLTEPNLWYLKTKRSDLDAHYSTRRGSLHYPDYDFHGNLSILQGHKKDPVLPIGAAALCVCCGNELWSNGDIKCSCKEVVVCRKCGQTVARGQGIYLEDGFYCKTCLHICEACGRPTLGTMYPAYDRRGSLLQICHDCYQQLTAINISIMLTAFTAKRLFGNKKALFCTCFLCIVFTLSHLSAVLLQRFNVDAVSYRSCLSHCFRITG